MKKQSILPTALILGCLIGLVYYFSTRPISMFRSVTGIQPVAMKLCEGLVPVEQDSQFRCGRCEIMQPAGSSLVWIPDSVRATDPLWSIKEAIKRNRHNGSGTGWCMACAPMEPAK